jgi:AhpD family alkylhydroperoxidase
MTARITPGGLRELGPLIWLFTRIAGRVTGTRPPAVFTVLGRGRGLFWGWLHFAGRLMPGGTLPRAHTELVILRVAHLRACDYEFTHHAALGRRAGLTSTDIQRVTIGSGADGWTEDQRLLLSVTEELLATKNLSDRTWRSLRARYADRVILEILLLIGHYDMLATVLLTIGLTPDER